MDTGECMRDAPALSMPLFIDEDTLRAALAFVDEWYTTQTDAPSDGNTIVEPRAMNKQDGSAALSVNATHEYRAMGPPLRKRTRTSRRKEIDQLRRTLQALEQKMRALVQAKEARGVAAASAVNEHPVCSHHLAPVWRDIAYRQSKQRWEAEAMNRSLRELLQDRLKVVVSLKQLVKKNEKRHVSLSPEYQDHVLPMRLQFTDGDVMNISAMARELMAIMEGMIVNAESIFADPCFQLSQLPTRPHQVVNTRDDAPSGTSVEMVDVRVLPFKFQTVAEAMWDNTINSHGLGEAMRHVVPASSDTVIKAFEGEFRFSQVIMRCNVMSVIHRLVERDQATFLVSILIRPEAMSGVRIRQRVWHVIRSAQELNGAGEGATISKLYKLATPEVYADDRVGGYEPKLAALTSFITRTIRMQLNTRLRLLENELLGRAC